MMHGQKNIKLKENSYNFLQFTNKNVFQVSQT